MQYRFCQMTSLRPDRREIGLGQRTGTSRDRVLLPMLEKVGRSGRRPVDEEMIGSVCYLDIGRLLDPLDQFCVRPLA